MKASSTLHGLDLIGSSLLLFCFRSSPQSLRLATCNGKLICTTSAFRARLCQQFIAPRKKTVARVVCLSARCCATPTNSQSHALLQYVPVRTGLAFPIERIIPRCGAAPTNPYEKRFALFQTRHGSRTTFLWTSGRASFWQRIA